MALKISFQADPPIPYHTSSYHIKQGFNMKLFEPSIRNQEFNSILKSATYNLRSLLKVPKNFYVIYMNTSWFPLITLLSTNNQIATIDHSNQFSRLTNMIRLVTEESIHLNPIDPGYHGAIEALKDSAQVLMSDTDPSTGNFFRTNLIQSLKGLNPKLNLHVDISYSVPTNDFDYDTIDSFFFKTNIGFGIYQGPEVWLVKKNFFNLNKEKIERILDIQLFDRCEDTYCDQNIDLIKIYALGQIAADFNNRSLKIIKNETTYKSIIINSAIMNSNSFDLMIKNSDFQSKNIIAFTSGFSLDEMEKIFEKKGILLDNITYKGSGSLIRIGNYPAHSKEQAELLADIIQSI